MKWKKSAGVPVTNAVHGLIRQGNAARDRKDWAAAADAYRAAVEGDPALWHIWIQLGHMQKEANRPDEAANAYEQALALRSDNPEPLMHIAHLHKTHGQRRVAAASFARAIHVGGKDDEALKELAELLWPTWRAEPASLRRAILHNTPPVSSQPDPIAAAAAIDRLLASPDAMAPEDGETLRSARALLDHIVADQRDESREKPGIVFDVTDLIAHFRYHRLPTGIQRVQIEVVTRALPDVALDARVCCFVDGRDYLIDIPAPLFMEMAALSTAGKDSHDPEWSDILHRLFLHIYLADEFIFRRNDILVNMGTSWWIYNYFLLVRNAKRDFGIRYIPMVHDLIPIMASDHCVTGVIEDYVSWLVGVFEHADGFLANSESTRNDLVRAAERLNQSLDPACVEVVPLNADFRQPADRALPASELGRWSLTDKPYCLFVSTIESRKNHILALDAWAQLIERHGAEKVPMLVCVGRNGWLNATFYERLDRDPQLRARVTLIERASDDELALLYRQCRFTLYPSHYEGWGLPVTESLCYGRVPVVADNSSLREAGGEFGVYFESNSVPALVAALERCLFEQGFIEALEHKIVARYQPRSWASIAAQVVRTAVRDQGSELSVTPGALPGRYYPVTLYKGTRIWRGLGSGEMFRAGAGWLWPEPEGCRTAPEGGELRIRPAGAQGPLRLYLRLRGLDSEGSAFLVSSGGHVIASGSLDASEERWVLGDIPATGENGIVSIHVRGGSSERVEMSTGGTMKQLRGSIRVMGFALLERNDEAGRMAFTEKVALGILHEASAYAEWRHGAEEKAAA